MDNSLLYSFISAIMSLFCFLIIVLAVVGGIAAIIVASIKAYQKRKQEYDECEYAKQTGVEYGRLRNDLGTYGEYLTYKALQKYESMGAKFLFNLYIPKSNGQTTEIDALMILPSGILVLESKNYSGWIFGNDKDKNWTQSLKGGTKNHFYNPVLQNQGHIKALRRYINDYNIPFYSAIVFSERCVLKSITVNTPDVAVIKREYLSGYVSQIANKSRVLSDEKIVNLYNTLYPLTQATDYIKAKHIMDIKQEQNTFGR